jgi:hypothetical protein
MTLCRENANEKKRADPSALQKRQQDMGPRQSWFVEGKRKLWMANL